MDGIPGASGVGSIVVTPRARKVPLVTCGMLVDEIENIICTAPPTTAFSAELASRNGTCTMSTPVITLNNSPARWGGVPIPEEA